MQKSKETPHPSFIIDKTPLELPATQLSPEKHNHLQTFLIFLKLGLTSFGGPIAHLGYFRNEFVERKKWLTDRTYGDLVALCQLLPGPTSSQVGMAIGLSRGGILGALLAWLGFTLPSAILLFLLAMVLSHFDLTTHGHWLHGLKVVTVAIVAQALWGMGKQLTPDKVRASIAMLATALVSFLPFAFTQVMVMGLGGMLGWFLIPPSSPLSNSPIPNSQSSEVFPSFSIPISKRIGFFSLAFFFILLIGLPLFSYYVKSDVLVFLDGFYRAGALVFGGGHVVLPLLQSFTVPKGWVTNQQFLAGYGAAQAVPGPLFTFAVYLGAVKTQNPSGFLGATLALIAIFLPAFLLVVGILPIWESFRRHPSFQRCMLGINAAVVGILFAAFYQPVFTSAITNASDFTFAAICFLLLVFWKVPSWIVVFLAVIATGMIRYL